MSKIKITKNYFVSALCLLLLSFTACKKSGLDEPLVQEGTFTELWSPYQGNAGNPGEDIRSTYEPATKTASYDIGKAEVHLNMLEKMLMIIEDQTYDKAELIDLRLNKLLVIPQPFQEETWTNFLEDFQVVFIPDNGQVSTVLANFSGLEFSNGTRFEIDIIDQNLVSLFADTPGKIAIDFTFSDSPDNKLSLQYTQFSFTGKYQTIRN